MELLDRIKQLRDNNPNFAKVLEESFPEIRNINPLLQTNENLLFMRKGYNTTIYVLYYDKKTNRFKIRNLHTGQNWTSEGTPTESFPYNYLSVYDFESMCKESMVKRNSIRFLNNKEIKKIYDNLF